MIRVTVGNNLQRNTVVVDKNTTLKKVLEDNDIDYTSTVIHLDGAPLTAGEINKTFAEMGIVDKCFLLGVVKAQNA